jgi:microcystin degradation protein MlrC
MRVAVACAMQESNLFAPSLSQLKDFSIERGDEIVATNRNANTEVGGFLDELARLRLQAVPTYSAWAIAAGPIDGASFDSLASSLVQAVHEAHADALLLALHGAWVAVGHSSADAELVRSLRAKLGADFPIVVTLDLHANVRPSLIENVDALVGYRTYPHIDMADTGRKAARVLHQIVTGSRWPCVYWLPIPLLAPAQTATTDRAPIANVIDALNRECAVTDLLSSSFFCVQPWLDLDAMASSLVVVAATEDPQVAACLRKIAQRLWDRRRELEMDWVEPQDLLDAVRRAPSRPVIVSEAFDATSGGAPGDHPGLLSLLVPHRESVSACLYLVDPMAAAHAREIGVGGHFTMPLGARYDARFQSPVHAEGLVRHVSDGSFTLQGPVFTGKRVDMGPTAVLEIGGVQAVVASRAILVIDPELYRSQRIEPAEQDVVGVKSPSLFRPGYASMLGTVLNLDMPGVCRGNLRRVPYEKISRPIWPLDDFEWHADQTPVFAKSATVGKARS